ncbi:Cadherin-20 [Anabarilius grahami]|uniref:Cadherin-20 n=1 Tax=Anabarilius grahami TaxID=495550 RepID=A0A3N0XMQ2_ANAGA|nr:Cadherin-20 [Anabarilius grahami]
MILLTTTSVVTEEPTTNMDYGDYVSQNGRSLEDYVEAYLELYHEVCWDDETLKHNFWSGMDDLLGQMLLPMPATESEPEPAPTADHELEPPPCPELVPATESTPEPEQVATLVPRPEPITRTSEKSGPVRQFSDKPVEERWLINFTMGLVPLQPTALSILDDPIPPNILPTPLSPSSLLIPSNSPDLPGPLMSHSSSTPPSPLIPPPARWLHLGLFQHQRGSVMRIPWLLLRPPGPVLHLKLSTLVSRHPGFAADFRASGCASTLYLFCFTGILLPSGSTVVLAPSGVTPFCPAPPPNRSLETMTSPMPSMSAMSPWAVVLVALFRVSTLSRSTAIARRPGSTQYEKLLMQKNHEKTVLQNDITMSFSGRLACFAVWLLAVQSMSCWGLKSADANPDRPQKDPKHSQDALQRQKRNWVWNQFFVLEEYTGTDPLYVGKGSISGTFCPIVNCSS